MAYSFNTNQTPATCAVAVYNLKTLLKAAGWTVPQSSDGTTYNPSGDQISSGGSGSNGMDNNRAWFVIQQASGSQQFCLQRQTSVGANTSYLWRVKYSLSAGFTGGSPSATQVPSATDEHVLLGSGTDAAPGFAALFGTSTDGGFRHSLLADNSGADGYSFASFAWVNTTAIPTHGFVFDKLVSSPTADTYNWVVYLNGANAASASGGVSGPGCFQYESIYSNNTKLVGHSTAGVWSTTIQGPMLIIYSGGAFKYISSGGMNANADGQDDVFRIPIVHYDTGASKGDWKGFSRLMRWSSVARVTGSTLTVSTSKDRVILCDISFPWDGSTPTV